MTNAKAGPAATPRRTTQADVVRAAFALTDNDGLGALTLRGVARHLGVHLNSVSFQVRTKARLLELMADEILRGISLDALPSDPVEGTMAAFTAYRSALLAHRDGGRIVAGTSVMDEHTLAFAEAVLSRLVSAGVDLDVAVKTLWGLHYFLIGLVQEEQSESGGAVSPATRDLLVDHPTLSAVASLDRSDGFEARFEFGLRALLDHALRHGPANPVAASRRPRSSTRPGRSQGGGSRR